MKLAVTLFAALLFVVMVQTVDIEECKPGQTKMNDCNQCRCINGKWACTLMACPKKREVSCEPSKTFMDKCNVCMCSSDGKGAACTQKGCPGE